MAEHSGKDMTVWMSTDPHGDPWTQLPIVDLGYIPPKIEVPDLRPSMDVINDMIDVLRYAFAEVSMSFEMTAKQFNKLWALVHNRLPAGKRRYLRMMARGRGEPAEGIK